MKVLKKGRPQKGWAVEKICTGNGNGGCGCGAELLVEQADVFRTTSYCMGEEDHHATFKCIKCGVLTDIYGPIPCSLMELPSQKAFFSKTKQERK